MHPVAKFVLSVLLLTSVLVGAYRETFLNRLQKRRFSIQPDNSAKLRRDGVLNLYPFPRVGRSSHRTWEVPLNDYLDEFGPAEKRSLYAFPRVGRGNPSLLRDPGDQQLVHVRRSDNSPGMWFGPRLGRSVTNDEDDIVIQNDNGERSEPEQLETDNLDRTKRGVNSN